MNYNPAPSPVSDEDWNDFINRKCPTQPWKQWFAWYPVNVHGKRVWLKTIYRRLVWDRDDGHIFMNYQYGTLFDLLTE